MTITRRLRAAFAAGSALALSACGSSDGRAMTNRATLIEAEVRLSENGRELVRSSLRSPAACTYTGELSAVVQQMPGGFYAVDIRGFSSDAGNGYVCGGIGMVLTDNLFESATHDGKPLPLADSSEVSGSSATWTER